MGKAVLIRSPRSARDGNKIERTDVAVTFSTSEAAKGIAWILPWPLVGAKIFNFLSEGNGFPAYTNRCKKKQKRNGIYYNYSEYSWFTLWRDTVWLIRRMETKQNAKT